MEISKALTFDDVLLVPKYSEILPSEVNTSITLSSNLKLKIPLFYHLQWTLLPGLNGDCNGTKWRFGRYS